MKVFRIKQANSLNLYPPPNILTELLLELCQSDTGAPTSLFNSNLHVLLRAFRMADGEGEGGQIVT